MYHEKHRHNSFSEYGTLVSVFAVCLCFLVLGVGCNKNLPAINDEVPETRGGLVVDRAGTWDFGPQPQKKELFHLFTLANATDIPIVFTGMKSSCGCTWAANNDRLIGSMLQPSMLLEFPVFLNTGASQDKASGQIALSYRQVVDDTRLACEGKLFLEVHATILPDYRMEPFEIDFGAIHGLDTQKVKTTFRITPDQLKTLEVNEITSSVNNLTCRILAPSESLANNHYNIDVELDVSSFTEDKAFRGNLIVSTNSTILPKGIVQVTAQYVAPVTVQPSSIIISSDKVGIIEEEVLVFTSVSSQLRQLDYGSSSFVRAECNTNKKAERHSVKLFVDPCWDDDIDQTIILELSLFPASGVSVSRYFPVSIYRFRKGD